MFRSFFRTAIPALSLMMIAANLPQADAGLLWTWDSGTFENWTSYKGDTQISIEPGRNGTFGLGAVNPPPFTGSIFPKLEITNQIFNLNRLVGDEYGYYLPMTSDIYVDVNRVIGSGHGEYLDLEFFGAWSSARFIVYPQENHGTIEDLGDGWYRYHFANLYHLLIGQGAPVDRPPGTIWLAWKDNFSATTIPVVYDNLTITPDPVPEPTSFAAFSVMAAITLAWRYRSSSRA